MTPSFRIHFKHAVLAAWLGLSFGFFNIASGAQLWPLEWPWHCRLALAIAVLAALYPLAYRLVDTWHENKLSELQLIEFRLRGREIARRQPQFMAYHGNAKKGAKDGLALWQEDVLAWTNDLNAAMSRSSRLRVCAIILDAADQGAEESGPGKSTPRLFQGNWGDLSIRAAWTSFRIEEIANSRIIDYLKLCAARVAGRPT